MHKYILYSGPHSWTLAYYSLLKLFKHEFVGSTVKPNDSKTTTPSRTLSITSEIQTGKASSLPFNFIHARPLEILIMPAPVETRSWVVGVDL